MPHPILERLEAGEILLSDGAMGTEIQKYGLATGGCPDEFNLTQPDAVKSIHRKYFEAGSDIVETNTFGANRKRLENDGLQDKVLEINTTAVELARSVCPDGRYVAGSIGPTGALLQPYGTDTKEEIHEIFFEQIEALVNAGADILFIETMMDITEAELAVQAARQVTDIPVSATMTFEVSDKGVKTSWGVDPETAVGRLTAAGADIVGANCGNGFEQMLIIIEAMRPLFDGYLLAQANAGTPIMESGETVFKETPGDVKPKAKKLLDAGINILGGCCGTGPEHIRVLRQLVDDANSVK